MTGAYAERFRCCRVTNRSSPLQFTWSIRAILEHHLNSRCYQTYARVGESRWKVGDGGIRATARSGDSLRSAIPVKFSNKFISPKRCYDEDPQVGQSYSTHPVV